MCNSFLLSLIYQTAVEGGKEFVKSFGWHMGSLISIAKPLKS